EDDTDIRESMAELLADEGYEVFEAGDGAEALSVLASLPTLPCVILLDLMMPRMDGWQFRKKQLADTSYADIPVVVCTGTSDPHDALTALGANELVTKPFAFTALIAAVRRHCDATAR